MTETTNETLVEMTGLRKRFGTLNALDGINLTIRRGRIIGLLGANGCGKSTLLRHIIGHLLPDAGECRTMGAATVELGANELGRIGYVHQEGELLGWMSVRDLINYVAAYYPNWDKELERRILAQAKLSETAKAGSLSPGQRQKLSILLAICFHPELLILDEPAAGLDPIARAQLLNLLVEEVQDERRTIVISSHILSDVEKVVDHVIILDEGIVLRDCPLDELREQFVRVRLSSSSGKLPESFPFGEVIEKKGNDRQSELIVQNSDRQRIAEFADESGCELEIQSLSLDECYRHVVESVNGGRLQ